VSCGSEAIGGQGRTSRFERVKQARRRAREPERPKKTTKPRKEAEGISLSSVRRLRERRRTWTIVGSFLDPSANSSKESWAFLSLSMLRKILSTRCTVRTTQSKGRSREVIKEECQLKLSAREGRRGEITKELAGTGGTNLLGCVLILGQLDHLSSHLRQQPPPLSETQSKDKRP
jgi:hypothetical protein